MGAQAEPELPGPDSWLRPHVLGKLVCCRSGVLGCPVAQHAAATPNGHSRVWGLVWQRVRAGRAGYRGAGTETQASSQKPPPQDGRVWELGTPAKSTPAHRAGRWRSPHPHQEGALGLRPRLQQCRTAAPTTGLPRPPRVSAGTRVPAPCVPAGPRSESVRGDRAPTGKAGSPECRLLRCGHSGVRLQGSPVPGLCGSLRSLSGPFVLAGQLLHDLFPGTQQGVCWGSCTHTHAYTHVHTHMHTHGSANIHTYMQAHTHAQSSPKAHTYVRTYTHAYIYIYTHRSVHIHWHTQVHTHACTGLSTNTHTHTRMHTIHTHMRTQPQAAEPPLVAACQG